MSDTRDKLAKALCLAMDDHYPAGKAFWLYQADLILALPEIAQGQLAVTALGRLLEVAEFAYMGAAEQPPEIAAAQTILRIGAGPKDIAQSQPLGNPLDTGDGK